MKKIKLDLNDLSIESFETVAPKGMAGGTIAGMTVQPDQCPSAMFTACEACNASHNPNTCATGCAAEYPTCNYDPTCQECESAYGTCDVDCNQSGCDEPVGSCSPTCGDLQCDHTVGCTNEYDCPPFTEAMSCNPTG